MFIKIKELLCLKNDNTVALINLFLIEHISESKIKKQ